MHNDINETSCCNLRFYQIYYEGSLYPKDFCKSESRTVRIWSECGHETYYFELRQMIWYIFPFGTIWLFRRWRSANLIVTMSTDALTLNEFVPMQKKKFHCKFSWWFIIPTNPLMIRSYLSNEWKTGNTRLRYNLCILIKPEITPHPFGLVLTHGIHLHCCLISRRGRSCDTEISSIITVAQPAPKVTKLTHEYPCDWYSWCTKQINRKWWRHQFKSGKLCVKCYALCGQLRIPHT